MSKVVQLILHALAEQKGWHCKIVQELSSWIAADLILPTYTLKRRLVLGTSSPSIRGSSSPKLQSHSSEGLVVKLKGMTGVCRVQNCDRSLQIVSRATGIRWPGRARQDYPWRVAPPEQRIRRYPKSEFELT